LSVIGRPQQAGTLRCTSLASAFVFQNWHHLAFGIGGDRIEKEAFGQ